MQRASYKIEGKFIHGNRYNNQSVVSTDSEHTQCEHEFLYPALQESPLGGEKIIVQMHENFKYRYDSIYIYEKV